MPAIDRVIRSFTFFGAAPWRQPPDAAVKDDAAAFAGQLLAQYREQLARHTVKVA